MINENSKYLWGTGRRKEAVAQVRISPGEGKFAVNRFTLDKYFNRDSQRIVAQQPLQVTSTAEKFDVLVRVKGGGKCGQAEAIRHGLARALLKSDETLHGVLKKAGYLTRDSRMKERKKYGQPGARKRFQFSKR